MLVFLGALTWAGERSTNTLKYFFIQRASRRVFLGVSAGLMGIIPEAGLAILSVRLALKLGMPPFHPWIVRFIKKLKWRRVFIAATVQKAIPLFTLGALGSAPWLLIALRRLVGALGAIAQIYLKTLIVYSSIFNLGWLVSTCEAPEVRLRYLGLYSIGLYFFCLVFRGRQRSASKAGVAIPRERQKGLVAIRLIRMGGVPPFIGFAGKLLVFSWLVGNGGEGIATLLLLSSIFILFIYRRVILERGPREKARRMIAPYWKTRRFLGGGAIAFGGVALLIV